MWFQTAAGICTEAVGTGEVSCHNCLSQSNVFGDGQPRVRYVAQRNDPWLYVSVCPCCWYGQCFVSSDLL